jgi:hypothetical protein
MAQIVEFETERVARYVQRVFTGYAVDPATSDFQRGYLAAMLDLYREGMGKVDDRFAQLQAQLGGHHGQEGK